MKKTRIDVAQMKCLSIRQPWALLVCVGTRTIENRTWTTSHRGEIAIHAGGYKDAVKHFNPTWSPTMRDAICFGAIIGVAELYDAKPYDAQCWDDPCAEGPFCLLLRNPTLFREPIPHSGRVNLCQLPDDVSKAVEAAKAYPTNVEESTLREDCLNSVPVGPVPKQFLRSEPKWHSPGH